ncbi:MAG: tetratricopeptide repeat protein [Myxococcota bacterium]
MGTAPQTAAEWVQHGLDALELSRSADTASDYRDDLRRAVEAFDRALALEPEHLHAQRLRGETLAKLGDHEGALDSLVVAAERAPMDLAATRAAASSFARLGRHEDALAAAEQVLAARPDDADLRFLQAELLTKLARDAEAVAAWDRLLASPELLRRVFLFGARARAKLLRASALTHARDARAAEAWRALFLEEFDQLRGPMAPTELFDALHQYEAARAGFRAAVEHRPTTANWKIAVEHLLRAQRSDEALHAAAQLIALAPSDSRAWFLQAEACAAAGDREAAIAAYERSLTLEPGFLGARARLDVVRRQ